IAAHADIGIAAADIDLGIGGDELDAEVIVRLPEGADMAGEESAGPVAGRNADDRLTGRALAPAADGAHRGLDVLGARQEVLAGVGQAIARLRADEEGGADLPLEGGDAPP